MNDYLKRNIGTEYLGAGTEGPGVRRSDASHEI